MLSRSPDAVFVHVVGEILFVNRALLDLLGHETDAALVGANVVAVVPPELQPVAVRAPTTALAHNLVGVHDGRLAHRDGGSVPVEVYEVAARWGGRDVIVSVARGIAARKRLEAHVHRMERIAAIGTLAAGVAHDINNPLTFVTANLEYALAELAAGEVDAVRLDEIEEAIRDALEGANRVGRVIRDLRDTALAEPDPGEEASVDKLIDAAVSLAAHEITHRARLVREVQPGLRVVGNRGRLEIALLNLLLNATAAMPDGRASSHTLTVRALPVGDYVRLEVQDTGRGMTEDVLAHALEPFFTTRSGGRGTGLGLAICRDAVEASGGQLLLKSQPGEGTTATLLLRSAAGPEPESAPSVEADSPDQPMSILVIDDEPNVGRALRRLIGPPHHVDIMVDPVEALTRIEAGERWDRVLCDVMMPALSGPALLDRLRRTAPDQAARVLFLTGGAFTDATRDAVQRSGVPVLDKPFGRRAVAAILGRPLRG